MNDCDSPIDSVPAIEVNNVSYTYPDGIQALKKISFVIQRGEKTGLVGPNGAGKSTLLTLLVGIRMPTTGTIKILGKTIMPSNLREIRRHIGLIFQDPDDQLFCPTVFDDVAFAPLNLGIPPQQVEQLVCNALNQVDLAEVKARSPFHLSYGEKKRVSFATVLSYSPEILLIDEPTANLDPRHRRQLIELLKQLPQSMLIATHDLDLVLEVCQKTLIINQGQITAVGDVETILTDEVLLLANGLELPLSRQAKK